MVPTDLATNPRDLLTPEQQELYDGVLADCAHSGQTATTVLDRYADMVDEQARDVTAVRAALGATDITSETTRVGLRRLPSEPGGGHPTWCTRSHPPQVPHSSDITTVKQDRAGHACAVVYLWQPPGKPLMLAAELTSDGDDEPHLYLFSVEAVRQLGRVASQLVQLTNHQTTEADPALPATAGNEAGSWLT
ncbi:MAG TPA: hypothetical protein VFM55_21755 [Micromonosporaceae bacterium]|nr:hypothetical protein [Micromonosporaceae bacterium]